MTHTLPTVNNHFKAPEEGNANNWLQENASETRKYLLAFAYDGVIWGEYQDGLKTSSPLDEDTLQQSHLFGKDDELRLFRADDGNWKACLITDNGVDEDDKIDEYQLLWGNDVLPDQGTPGFTRVRDRIQQTMEHALPLPLKGVNLDIQSPRLLVRHFIEYDKLTGEARIFLSRLVKLGTGPIAEEKIND